MLPGARRGSWCSSFISRCQDEKRSESYFRGAQEIAFGLMTDQDKVKGMFDYSVWYYNLLKKEGLVNDE